MPKLKYLYGFLNDVSEMRAFYSDRLALKETSYTDTEEWGWLAYDLEGTQLMFFRLDGKTPVPEGWAWQPGETIEEAVPRMSFSILYTLDQLREAVKRLKDGKVDAQTPDPTWRQGSYWGWTIRDPMGNTIEVFASPPEPPAAGVTPEWTD